MSRVRRIQASDEARWRELWAGYISFYQTAVAAEVTDRLWSRILDPTAPVYAIVAEDASGQVIGFAHYLLHENTFHLAPGCYLEDLFVDPAKRAAGAGKALIDWLVAEMHEQGWSRLYWHTDENNYRARGLYDKYGKHGGVVRYLIANQ